MESTRLSCAQRELLQSTGPDPWCQFPTLSNLGSATAPQLLNPGADLHTERAVIRLACTHAAPTQCPVQPRVSLRNDFVAGFLTHSDSDLDSASEEATLNFGEIVATARGARSMYQRDGEGRRDHRGR